MKTWELPIEDDLRYALIPFAMLEQVRDRRPRRPVVPALKARLPGTHRRMNW